MTPSSFPQPALSAPGPFPTTVSEEKASLDVLCEMPPADGHPVEALPTIGHIGRYLLKYKLGEGGLGTVYAAFDPVLSRAVAVKTLHLACGDDADFEAALLHEARAAAALNHPHIVTVHDAGSSDDSVYLAMEQLDGRDLRHLLARGWRAKPRQAALIVRRVADALAYAHGKGVIHCDVKPANIFMVGRTTPKVLDFGIARVAQRPDSDTQALAGGSPYYMAPEQIRGDAIDGRCDVYSLGVVLHELLTGRRAFSGSTLDEICDAVLNRVPARAHHCNPTVPAELSEIAARAMAKDRDERQPSAQQLALELRHWLGEDTPASQRRAIVLPVVAAGLAVVAALGWAFDAAYRNAPPAVAAAPAAAAVAPRAAVVAAAVAATPVVASPADIAPVAAPDDSRASAADALPLQLAAGPSKRRATRPKPAGEAPAQAAAAVAPPPAPGLVQIAVSPWGAVEVDGAPAGTTPPLTRLSLPAGRHVIVIRNADFAPHSATVDVSAERPVTVKHRFGS